MATETVKLTYDYGKYKYFEFTGGSSTVDVEFSWESPKLGPDKRPIPKNVVDLFNKNVRAAIQDLMKTEETTVNAIKKQIQAWEQKIANHQIPGQQLFGFINMVNDTLEERSKDRFAAIGGIATVMKMIVKRAFAALDQAVRDMLEKEKWIIYAKTVGKVVLALTATAIAIVATVLTGGAALPLVLAAAKITANVVVEGKAAYDSFSAGADEVVALQNVVKKHRIAAEDAMKSVKRAEDKRYLMAGTVVKLEKQAQAAEAKYAEVERVLSQKKIDGVTISEDSSLIDLVSKVSEYRKLTAALTKKLAESQHDLKKLDDLIEGAKSAFDPKTYANIPSADWKAVLKKYAEEYGSTIRTLGQMGQNISTIVEKMA
jgi:hypothetical protein